MLRGRHLRTSGILAKAALLEILQTVLRDADKRRSTRISSACIRANPRPLSERAFVNSAKLKRERTILKYELLASFWRKTPVMSQKGVKECSAGFQPAEGLLQTKSLPSSTCRQDAGATISLRLLSPARRFAPETS